MTETRQGYRMFRTAGPGRNTDPRIALLRKADTAASSRFGSGGVIKRRSAPRAVTLPTLETARRITKDEK